MRIALALPLLAAAIGVIVAPAVAQDTAPPSAFTLSGSAGVWSQYRFRGISQSDNKPVVQGSLTLTHRSGFYLSAWGSSASGNDAVDIGGSEVDIYGGYSHSFAGSGVTVDGGLYGYLYPGSVHAVGASEDYYEVYGDVSKTAGPLTAKLGVNWAPDQDYFRDFATPTRYSIYAYGELGLAVPTVPVSVHAHLGHTGGGLDYAGHPYFDYTVGASYKWKLLTFDLSVVGANVKNRYTRPLDLADGTDDFHRDAKTALVASVSASF